ncbi:MAG: hypothetical protein VW268_09600 [Rhodospirillaceae bacterium]
MTNIGNLALDRRPAVISETARPFVVLTRSLEIRLVETEAEIAAAQRLR